MNFFIIITIIMSAQVLLANDPVVSEPTSPTPPVLSPGNDSHKKDKKGKKQIDVQIKLCDGREVKGRMEYQKEELFFQHDKEGIKYTKKVQMQMIKQIHFLTYSSKQIKKTKDGIAYQFDPGEIEISLKDNEVFKIYNMGSNDFQKIEIQNSNGTTLLFTYWIDLLYDSGIWYSKLPSIKGNYRVDCHPDVVRMIRIDSNLE